MAADPGRPGMRRAKDWFSGLPHLPALTFLSAYVVLLLVVPAQLIFRPLGAPGTLANMVGLGALLWWCGARLGGLISRRVSPVRLLLGGVTVAVLAAYVSGMLAGWYAPSNMRQGTDDVWTLVFPTVSQVHVAMVTAADRGLLSFGAWLGIALLTVDGLRSWRDLDVLVRVLCWTTALYSATGIYQFYTGTNLAAYIKVPGLSANSVVGASLTRSILERVSSTASHPIEFAVVVACVLPLALHLAIHRRRRRDLLPVLILGFAMPLAVSRSGILAIGLSLIIMFCYWPPAVRRKALWVGPLTVVALRVAVPGLVGTIYSLFAGIATDPSVTGRTDDYGVVMSLYYDQPWFGRGLFTFVPGYYRILDNQMLMVLVELGAVGLVAVLLLYFGSIGSALGARRRALAPRDSHVSLAIAAAIAGMLAASVTFDAWGFAQAAGLTFLLVGMAGAVSRLSHEDREATAPSHPRPLELQEVRGA